MFSRRTHPGNGTAARHSARRIDLTATAGPDVAATSMAPGATWNTPVVLPLAQQRSVQAICSARSLIPRSIFWLITKLTASTGSTRNRAHGRV
jgi:hypothetical protein